MPIISSRSAKASTSYWFYYTGDNPPGYNLGWAWKFSSGFYFMETLPVEGGFALVI
jgi:hypothetical protein